MDCPKRSAVDGLPEDSLVEILSRVPTRSVYRSKCVAKGWRDLVDDPLHSKKIPQTLQGFFSIDKAINGRGCRASGGAHVGFTSLRARSAPLGIDSRLSFLTKLPGIKILTLADSCNGLLLFEHGLKGYIVCNPAKKHWVSVPRSPYPRGEMRYTYLVFNPRGEMRYTYLVFNPLVSSDFRNEKRYTYLVLDPVVSSHFHIVQLWFEFTEVVSIEEEEEEEEEEELGWKEVTKEVYRISVHVYSSETRTWSHIQSDWEEELGQLEEWRHQGFIPRKGWGWGCAVLNGMLHFIISDQEEAQDQIVAVDVQGETQRAIPLPARGVRRPGYVAQSQGRLHYISHAFDAELSIWVLEDYDTQKWVLKHSVSFVELFGKKWYPGYKNEHRVVAMHPDGNVVFIVQNRKLISYDMDHKLVNVIATSENNISAEHIVAYVPCFLESPALTNKH